MSHHLLLITFSWIGSASLQYINTGGQDADSIINPLDATLQYSLPIINYFKDPEAEAMDDTDIYRSEAKKLRGISAKERSREWLPNLLDGSTAEKTMYLTEGDLVPPIEDRKIEDIESEMEKKNFSPWGGKRNEMVSDIRQPHIIRFGSGEKINPFFEHMWTWKRAAAIREPSMPKRVRFSPWGGKRSGQMIYKPGNKSSKVIYSTSIPELTRIVSNYSPNGHHFNLARFQFIPGVDKRHPIKILALSADSRIMKEAMPFRSILDSLPKMFKPGHPYTDLHLKKDGKRKVKFSAWGGKRSPPLIGPIWTPASQDVKEATLNTIVLIRNDENGKHKL